MVLEQLDVRILKMTSIYFSHCIHKLTQNGPIIKLKMKKYKLSNLWKKTREKFCDLGLGKKFLDMT